MLKIRLMRIGAKQKPFYRVVVIDERSKRSGEYIELVGTYNPLTNPKEIKLKKDRVEHWIKQGAQKSDGFLRILGEAPQKPPRKPKKEKQPAAAKPQPSDKTEEKPAEETTQANTSLGIPTSDDGSVSEAKADSSKVSTAESAETTPETVIPSTSEESGDSSPAEPVQNDKIEEDKKDEGSA